MRVTERGREEEEREKERVVITASKQQVGNSLSLIYLQRGRSSIAPVHNLGDPVANPLCTAGELGVRVQDVELVSLMQKVLVP